MPSRRSQAERPLAFGQLRAPARLTGCVPPSLVVLRVEPQRAAVSRQLLDVEDLEPVGGEAPCWAVRNEK